MSKGTKRKGYTLIEALVSAILITVGIVSIIGAYTNISRNQQIAVQSEHMQILAMDKYQELVATEALQTQALNGDFTDRGEDKYLWEVTVTPTGTTNVSAVTVTVTPRDDNSGNKGVINGVVYQPPQTATTGAAGTPGGTP